MSLNEVLENTPSYSFFESFQLFDLVDYIGLFSLSLILAVVFLFLLYEGGRIKPLKEMFYKDFLTTLIVISVIVFSTGFYLIASYRIESTWNKEYVEPYISSLSIAEVEPNLLQLDKERVSFVVNGKLVEQRILNMKFDLQPDENPVVRYKEVPEELTVETSLVNEIEEVTVHLPINYDLN
ncbi:hypothetical protein [Bacillus sp. RO1]|uniref:hypothetical protein n=1 Tax=Bacillus sp. RO1 TaxID=2722703 RepID=UPI00145652D2|nr:hypothetical protein [Bacillus sp. RO1]NLP52154.1 hypothetical protein [Bacillus sp. RO1]